MNKFSIKRNSMMKRLLHSMNIILVIQVLIFISVITWGGTIKQISNNSFEILEERVLGRKNYLENEMIQRWSNLTGFEQCIQNERDDYLKKESQIDINDFLGNIADKMVIALRQQMVTGIFIILEGDEQEGQSGIYIRDMDPLYNPYDNSDILLERGTSTIARNLGAPLDSRWAPRFMLSKDNQQDDFYYKPFLAAKTYKDIPPSELGYWSKPFRLSKDDIEVITYSIPLLDKYSEPYGVIGIDISVDYLGKMLQYDEIISDKKGSYLLGIGNESNKVFENIVSSGPLFKRLIGSDQNTVFERSSKTNPIYELKKTNRIKKTTYGAIQYLNLYNRNTPFTQDQWALIGIVESGDLLKSTKQLQLLLVLSLFIAIIFGIISALIAGKWFTKPIIKMIQQMRNSDPNKPVILEKTNIIEIDELSTAIEYLSDQVADSASKLSRVIEMVNTPIGAFEYTIGQEIVHCTKASFSILGMKLFEGRSEYIDYHIFEGLMNHLKKNPEPDLEDVYRLEENDGSIRWIRLQTQEINEKILGVVEDVTDKTVEKRKIEYERDHDMLTQLINRRAFRNSVTKKIRENNIKLAAFIMWDLDSLKYINDIYGHDYGDLYIKSAANVLSEFTVYNGIIARMSGDEFLVFLYGYNEKDDIRYIINMMMRKLNDTSLTMPDGDEIRIRASAGIAWYPDDSDDYDRVIKYADFAMYQVKNTVKGNVGEFDKKNYKKNSFLLHGKEELNRLIDQKMVRFAFQPIVDAKTGEVFAYEALMRPQLETLKSPLDVIRIAHSQSKLHQIERITWFKALEAYSESRERFGEAKLFVNSIPNHILSEKDIGFIEKRYKDDLGKIVIEIIENEQADEHIIKRKQEIAKDWNCQLALDDFGSGYNSEIALLILSPSYVKIDMTIIRNIDQDLNRQKLLQNILSYAKGRQIKIIAEGVETKAEMDKVIEFGVDYLQGYYLGRPEFEPQGIDVEVVKEIRGE